MKQMRQGQSQKTPRRTRGRGLRTTTGCVTCRKRHLKCDESRPICQHCAKKEEICVYPEPPQSSSRGDINTNDRSEDAHHGSVECTTLPTLLTRGSVVATELQQPLELASTPQAHAQSAFASQSQDPQQTRETTNAQPTYEAPQDFEELATNPALLATQPDTLGDQGPGSILPDDHFPIDFGTSESWGSVSVDQPIDVAAARWFGMLAGDAYEETPPALEFVDLPQNHASTTATNDILNNKSGSLSANRVSIQDAPTQDETVISTAGWDGQPTSFAEKGLWQSQSLLILKKNEQAVFRNFVTHISEWLDLFDPQRQFSSLVPRLALYNTGLLNAILALSVRQQSLRYVSAEQPPYAREDALQYYYETLQYVRNAMRFKSYHTSLELLATTLIISTYEMLDGSSQNWERHLQGVFWIQRSQIIHGDSGGLRAAVWWNWLSQDVWAAFREKRRVFTFWQPVRELSDLCPTELAARAIFLFAKVVNYCVEEDSINVPNAILTRLQTGQALTAKLDEWESLTTEEFSPLPFDEAHDSSVFRNCWIFPSVFAVSIQIHHASRILILLHRPSLGGINESMQRQASLDRHVDIIGGIASVLTDYGSSTYSSQCLFIAGLCTHDSARRNEIVRLLQLCRLQNGWPVTRLDVELTQRWQETASS